MLTFQVEYEHFQFIKNIYSLNICLDHISPLETALYKRQYLSNLIFFSNKLFEKMQVLIKVSMPVHGFSCYNSRMRLNTQQNTY